MRTAILLILATFTSTRLLSQDVGKLTFDVASVKPTPPDVRNLLLTDYCRSDGTFSVSGAPVSWSVQYAFDLRDWQVVGMPSWATDFVTTYAIEAKPAAPVSNAQCRSMLQALFADRFKLTTHQAPKETSVYFLTIAKGGSKLKPGGGVQYRGSIQQNGDGSPQWPDGWDMKTLAIILSDSAGRPVLDHTGLTGTYGIKLDFSRTNTDGKPGLLTALQEQLGLKLESGKATIPILVIDHIEKPSAN